MILKIAAALVVLIAAVLIFATTRPDSFHVERTTNIKAPPEKIFPLIADLHSWPTWSPYEKLDPAMKKTYSGAANGKGAAFSWDGNSNVGAGRVEIAGTTPSSKIDIKLDMTRPMEGHNNVEFRLTQKEGGTDVTWAMDGQYAYVAKVIGLFLNMDKMMGGEFENGLANLKKIAEQ